MRAALGAHHQQVVVIVLRNADDLIGWVTSPPKHFERDLRGLRQLLRRCEQFGTDSLKIVVDHAV